MKKHILVLMLTSLLFGLYNCSTPNETDSENHTSTDTTKTGDEFVRTAENFDGVNEYTPRMIDSLKYTYSTPAPDGLYYVPKHGSSTIDLLPLQMWTRMTTLDANWTNADKSYTWFQFHRLDHTNITSGGRPGEITKMDSLYQLFVPFDGNTSNRVMQLLEKYPEGDFILLIDEKGTSIHAQGEGIASDGMTLLNESKEALQQISSHIK